MKHDLQSRIDAVENMMRIQQSCLERGYMHGMMNGLICAHSAFTKTNPEFVKLPHRKVKIRHKARKLPSRNN